MTAEPSPEVVAHLSSLPAEFRHLLDHWDDPQPTADCRHCHGDGWAPGGPPTRCGFCFEVVP